ncbi:MAG: hypothetical protein M5U09_19775 [Gammaproteobacteria bacterium]|nr:hypothetical protein [Gammaproteobacteria bacterium]
MIAMVMECEIFLDEFPDDPAEWVDSDDDGTGDNADLDDDNDGMSDIYEQANGLDPLDPSDATGDLDLDGYTNLEEHDAGTDPQLYADNPAAGTFAQCSRWTTTTTIRTRARPDRGAV